MQATAIALPTGGIGNRLLGITSTLAVAERCSLPFAMLWEPGMSFDGTGWHDLFANEYELIDREAYEAAIEQGAPLVSGWLADDSRESARAIGRQMRERGFVFDDAGRNLDALLRGRGVRIRGCRSIRNRLYGELRPAQPIAAEVSAFARLFFDGHDVIGVHIRRGDALSGPYREEYLPSTDEAFRRAIEREAGPRTRFFLATDSAETQARFRGEYGDRIICYEKTFVESVFGELKSGQHAALVEMLLLSRTRRVIGTRWSTFGGMAARLGGIPFDPAIA